MPPQQGLYREDKMVKVSVFRELMEEDGPGVHPMVQVFNSYKNILRYE